MEKHTPGPWNQVHDGRVMAGEELIASAWYPRAMPNANEERNQGETLLDARKRLTPLRDAIESEMDANARLIAAAPELLEALQACIAKGSKWHPCDPVVLQASAAIAKATGAA